MTQLSKPTDTHGNYWPPEQPLRSDISAEAFSSEFSGFETIAVEMASDRIVAAGHGPAPLAAGFADRGIDPKLHQLEPGPLDALLPDLAEVVKKQS